MIQGNLFHRWFFSHRWQRYRCTKANLIEKCHFIKNYSLEEPEDYVLLIQTPCRMIHEQIGFCVKYDGFSKFMLINDGVATIYVHYFHNWRTFY